jgi:glycosyltransferase involved in cell wall biosynthesis
MVNSSWTANHIRSLWRWAAPPQLVYPPVDTDSLQQLPLDRCERTRPRAPPGGAGQQRAGGSAAREQAPSAAPRPSHGCRRLKHLYLISLAQFRPEKNHELQLEAYALARQRAGGVGVGVGGWWWGGGARAAMLLRATRLRQLDVEGRVGAWLSQLPWPCPQARMRQGRPSGCHH